MDDISSWSIVDILMGVMAISCLLGVGMATSNIARFIVLEILY